MNTFTNYIGQLRLYSLVDLVLLAIVAQANVWEACGIVVLHIGFLAYLEARHSHSYRKPLPQWVWIAFVIVGTLLYKHIEALPFLLFSYLYTKKSHGYFAAVSPLFRGLQYFFLIAGVTNYHHPLPWVALLVTVIRNFAGDVRDAAKDKGEHMKTIPVIIGLHRNIRHIHLITTLLSSTVWWSFGHLPLWILLLVMCIEISTYNLTPR